MSSMQTPFYLKEIDNERLPEDPVSYTLSRDGLFINRSTPLFTASVPCRHPRELARHEASLEWTAPIPQQIAERAVGFFQAVNDRHVGAEAVILLGWSPETGYEVIVPQQHAVVARHAFGRPSPVRVKYAVPPLPPGLLLAGDIHSHAYMEAFSSEIDDWDTRHRPGLHITVGRVDLPIEPPDLYATVVTDQFTFIVENALALFLGYERRSTNVPEEWLSRVAVEEIAAHSISAKHGVLKVERKLHDYEG